MAAAIRLPSPAVDLRISFRSLDGAGHELDARNGRWADPVSPGGTTLDLADLWCLAGLADAHAHLSQDRMVLEPGRPEEIRRRAYATLEQGVFLCLDKGWGDRAVLTLLDTRPEDRPDLQAAGRMIAAPGGYYPGFGVEVDDDGLVAAVAAEASASAGWVKLVGDWPRRGQGALANFSEAALSRAVALAHAAGARVALHTMAPEVASTAVRAGVDSIEHGLFLTEDDVRVLGARGGAWVPTILRVEAVIAEVGPERTGGRLLTEGLDRVRSLLPIAADAGVAVLAGTDLAVPSREVGAEAIRLAAFGLPAAASVASASTAAFRYAGIPSGFEPTLPADLVAFDRHPEEDLGVLTRPVLVIRLGRVLLDRRR
jgi:imidazolonepropionase-like amidohydrolase